jgi:hypothetical protein
VQTFRCNPKWAQSTSPRPRYDDVEVVTEAGADRWFGKLLSTMRYTHHYRPDISYHACPPRRRKRGRRGAQRQQMIVIEKVFDLAFIRTYYPDRSIVCSERQPFPPFVLKRLDSGEISHHIISISSILRPVFMCPRSTRPECLKFLLHDNLVF